jgi:inner membrane transporter RhtA
MSTQAAGPRGSGGRAVLLVVVIALSFQLGSALAVKVIDSVGVVEALWLRTAVAAAILACIRPRTLRLPPRGRRLRLAALTLALLGMNGSFYLAISHVPVGLVVAIEFTGPLVVAVIGSRRALDFVWIALAGAGVVVLAGPSGSVSAFGLGLCLLSAFFWGLYIVLAKHAVSDLDPFSVTTLMLIGSAIVITPMLLISGPVVSGHGTAVLLGISVAVLSSAFPYVLEMVGLKLVKASTWGVLLSVEPAVACLTGFLVLGQTLTWIEIAAIAAVIVAAAGASWTAGAGEELEIPTG